jgi:hypothetical protein
MNNMYGSLIMNRHCSRSCYDEEQKINKYKQELENNKAKISCLQTLVCIFKKSDDLVNHGPYRNVKFDFCAKYQSYDELQKKAEACMRKYGTIDPNRDGSPGIVEGW